MADFFLLWVEFPNILKIFNFPIDSWVTKLQARDNLFFSDMYLFVWQ